MFPELREKGERARQASHQLAVQDTATKNNALRAIAETIMEREPEILSANDHDIDVLSRRRSANNRRCGEGRTGRQEATTADAFHGFRATAFSCKIDCIAEDPDRAPRNCCKDAVLTHQCDGGGGAPMVCLVEPPHTFCSALPGDLT